MQDQRIKVSDGTTIACSISNAGADKPRLVLLHSLGMDRHFWAPVVAELAGDVNVLTLDCRGHGESDKPAGPYTSQRFAQDLSEVLDAIGWSHVVVAGASMGGCVTLQFAADHSDRLLGLGLFDSTAWYGDTAPQDWDGRAKRALSEGLEPMVEFQLSRWFSDAFRAQTTPVLQSSVDTFLANDRQAFANTCHMLGAFDARAALPHIRVPTTVVVGEQDYATPLAMAQTIKDGIAQASLHVIDGARHLTPLEVPARVAHELRTLMAQCSARA